MAGWLLTRIFQKWKPWMRKLQRWSHDKSLRQVITRKSGFHCWFWERFSVTFIFCYFHPRISIPSISKRKCYTVLGKAASVKLHWFIPLKYVSILGKLGKFLFYCWKYNYSCSLKKKTKTKPEYFIGWRKWSHIFSLGSLVCKTDPDNLLHNKLLLGRVWLE